MRRVVCAAFAVVGAVVLMGCQAAGQASSEPSTAPSSAPSAAAGNDDEVHAGALDPGTYTAHGLLGTNIDVQFTVPDGWAWNSWYLSHGGVHPPDGAAVAFFVGDIQVYTDPCQWESAEPDPPTGAGAADVIHALAAQPTRDAGETIDRGAADPEGPDAWPGMAVQVSVPSDLDFADCDGSQFQSWGPRENGRWHQGAGQVDYVWAIDVDDVRLVVDGNWFPGTPADIQGELQTILDSIVIGPSH